MNQAEREAISLVNTAVNHQLSCDLNVRMALAKNEIHEVCTKAQAIIHGIVAKYNVPIAVTVCCQLNTDSVKLNKEVQGLIDSHIKKLPEVSEPLEMY